MVKQHRWMVIFVLATACASWWAPAANAQVKPAQPKRPNFVFIYTDDQRWDAMGVVQREHGDKARFPWLKTPNMDRLAAQGTRFRNAFVVNSLCAPSRASFLTGLYGHKNGIVNNHTPFPVDNVTWATRLRRAGYVTGYIGKWHMGQQKGQRPGFDFSASFVGQGKYFDCPVEVNGKVTATQGWVDDVSTDFGVRFLRENKDKPFALAIGFKATHGPFEPPPRHNETYAGEQARPVPNLASRAIYRQEGEPKKKKPAAKGGGNLGYFRCISAADDNLGKILKALDDLGLTEDTIVIFASDNGYYLGEHGLGDKRSAYEESLRIPFIVRYPRLANPGRVMDEMVLNVDLAPTLLDFAGAAIPKEMHGRSFRPLLEGTKTDWRQAFFYCYFYEKGYPGIPTVSAVRTEKAVMIKYPGHDEWTEVFDLVRDPYQMKNLVKDAASADLRRELEAEYDRQSRAIDFRIPEFADQPAVGSLSASPSFAQDKSAAEEIFTRQVQPMLKAKCLGCHGEDPKLRGGLDLRSREMMLKGGDTGPALVPGSASRSLLYQSVLRKGDVAMPPKEDARLTSAETTALKTWLDAGAPWPKVKAAAGTWKIDPRDAWAFQPVRRPIIPTKGLPAAAVKTPIDAFILEKLGEQSLQAAAAADRPTWIRRATFDLTGLPPTPEQIDAFAGDETPDAFAKVIDRLLQSPHYGERMAQHWLDVVRYADTAGFSNDYERPHAWRYRDYVIRAFNEDKPFDRFIQEQIAGDELDAHDPQLLIAAGYLRLGPWEHTGMSVAALTRQMFLDDVTNSIGVTFLGQGLSCARCHDHKFDPVPTKDYYRIQAVFAATQFAERQAPYLAVENTAGFAQAKHFWQRKLKDHQENKCIQPLSETKGNKTFFMITKKHDEYFKRSLERYEPLAFSVTSAQAAEVAILKGGALEAPGDVVTPGVLSAVDGSGDIIPQTDQGRRLALSRWIASPKNPLTARVLVNRVWQMHFGTGLVVTPNNFGKMGGRPSHPELLDWLAGWFVDNGWSIKKLHRLIMTSAVYEQSGAHPDMDRLRKVDAKNRLLAYFPPRRLSAEEIRDAMLSVSGELSATRCGPGVYPEINWEVALQPRHTMGGIAPAYQPSSTREERNRRTIYVFRLRTLADPMLEVLNRPGTELSCERRDETTVTPQVFTLFNGQNSHARALALALRLEKAAATGSQRIDLAYRLLFGRLPTEHQRALCLKHVATMQEHHRRQKPVAVARPTKVVRQMLAEQTGELFRWEEQLDAHDYQPDVAPWQVDPETRAWAELCLVLLNANEFMYVY